MRRPIYYDTETTGLKMQTDRIVEIAAYDPTNDSSFVSLIRPDCPIPAAASAVHHITDEMCASAPPFEEVGAQFAEFCSGDVVLIAHNNDAFDFPFIQAEFQRCNLSFPDWQSIDSLRWARRYRPDLPRHTLQYLREAYDIPANQAHRALDDVKILYQIFMAMTDDLTIEVILELMNREEEFTEMPFGKHRGTPLDEVPKSYLKWLKGSGALDKPGNKSLAQAINEVLKKANEKTTSVIS